MKKFYPINLIKMTKIENKKWQVLKIKRKALFTFKIFFYRTLHLFPTCSWDDSKRVRGGR